MLTCNLLTASWLTDLHRFLVRIKFVCWGYIRHLCRSLSGSSCGKMPIDDNKKERYLIGNGQIWEKNRNFKRHFQVKHTALKTEQNRCSLKKKVMSSKCSSGDGKVQKATQRENAWKKLSLKYQRIWPQTSNANMTMSSIFQMALSSRLSWPSADPSKSFLDNVHMLSQCWRVCLKKRASGVHLWIPAFLREGPHDSKHS